MRVYKASLNSHGTFHTVATAEIRSGAEGGDVGPTGIDRQSLSATYG